MTRWKSRLGACLMAVSLLLPTFSTTLTVYAEEPSVQSEGTVVDLTDVYAGVVAEHDCNLYLVEKYDEHHHWDECSFCNEKYNEEEHHFITMGNPSCIWSSNGLTSYCTDCGYSYNHKNRHTDDTSHWETRVDAKWHYYKCTTCGSYGSVWESCVDADGNPITCKGGTCAVCGYTYPANVHSMYSSAGGESGTVTCNGCGEEMIAFDQNKAEWIGDNKVHLSARITWWNPEVFGSDINVLASTVRMGGTGSGITGQTSDMQVTVQNGAIYMSCNVTYPYDNYDAVWANQVWSVYPYCIRIECPVDKVENVAPTIEAASIAYGDRVNDYSTKAQLSVKCSDNWTLDPNTVSIRLVDENEEPQSDWITCNRNADGTFTQTIDLVTEASGMKTFYLQAMDGCGNTAEKAIDIVNLDSKAPVMTSSSVSSDEWSQTKTITFTCNDEGSGNVEIAFNDQSDFQRAEQNGTSYSRTYTFTGDVYGEARGAVYFKDAVGNITTEFVIIKNLDNTAPTIESLDWEDAFDAEGQVTGWNVLSAANDQNEKLEQDGSGIVGYALVNMESGSPMEQFYGLDNRFFVLHSGSYYLWVKDAAGNVARVKEPITLHSDVYFNNTETNALEYNGMTADYFYYNGVRLRV